MPNKEYTTVTGPMPDDPGWVGTTCPITEIRVTNMDDIGKLVVHFGHTSVALTPAGWDVVINALVAATGPTRRLTIAEKLDAAAKQDDGGQAFGDTLNDFITALGGTR